MPINDKLVKEVDDRIIPVTLWETLAGGVSTSDNHQKAVDWAESLSKARLVTLLTEYTLSKLSDKSTVEAERMKVRSSYEGSTKPDLVKSMMYYLAWNTRMARGGFALALTGSAGATMTPTGKKPKPDDDTPGASASASSATPG